MVEPWILLILAALSCFLGFVWLALAMSTHWQQAAGGSLAPNAGTQRQLRALGSAGLMVSAICCFLADRPSMAILVWIMLLAASVPLVGMLLAYRPAWLRWAWPALVKFS